MRIYEPGYEHSFSDRPEPGKEARIDQASLNRRLETAEELRPEKTLAGAGDNLPEVQGFEQSGLSDNAAVKRYLQDTFPPEHVDQNMLKSVGYEDVYKPTEGGNFLGMTQYDRATGACNIEIYRQRPEGNYDASAMTYTLTHEVGHNAYWRCGEPVQRGWDTVSAHSRPEEYVTQYARSGVREDFAESYAHYVLDHELLREVSPTKYDFMKDQVFQGREYR